MENYLSRLPERYRKWIVDVSEKNRTLDRFLNLLKNNNIYIFENSVLLPKENIEKTIESLKNKCIKAYGVDVVKNGCKNSNPIENIKLKLGRLEDKLTELDKLIFLLNHIQENGLFERLNYPGDNENYDIKYGGSTTETKRIKYSKKSCNKQSYGKSTFYERFTSSESIDTEKSKYDTDNIDLDLFISSDHPNFKNIIVNKTDIDSNLMGGDKLFIAEYSNCKK